MVLRRNILVLHTGALGDFILMWPLLMALGRLFPQQRVIAACASTKGKLAERLLGVESIDIETIWRALRGETAPVAQKYLSGASTVFSFVSSPDDSISPQLQQATGGAEVVCLKPAPRDLAGIHASDWLVEQVQSRPALAESIRQMIRSINERGVKVSARGKGIIIHPGSGGETKTWPLTRFEALAERLRSRDTPIHFVIGEVEQERLSSQQIARLEAIAEVKRPADYVKLAEELSATDIYIGNDTGPSHLAAALGLRTIALFGPTDPNVWQPLGPHVNAIHHTALQEIEVEEVLAAVHAIRAHAPESRQIGAEKMAEDD